MSSPEQPEYYILEAPVSVFAGVKIDHSFIGIKSKDGFWEIRTEIIDDLFRPLDIEDIRKHVLKILEKIRTSQYESWTENGNEKALDDILAVLGVTTTRETSK